MKIVVVLAVILSATASAATRHNDDSCDIAVLPAATLLLPYFEVDLDDWQVPRNRANTVFTITNVSNEDAIARVTLWTDFAFPVVTFDIYLTGYDVQAISLFDVIDRGLVAPDAGTGTDITQRRKFSDPNGRLDLSACKRLPGGLDDAYVVRMQSAFLEGEVPDLGTLPGCDNVGNEHDHAVGYATIDVVGRCSSHTPFDPEYWTEDIRYDNILLGDYQQHDGLHDLTRAGPMVHIRAIPEGGTPGSRSASPWRHDAGFARTFYARYQPPLSPNLDGRQPLPAQFATRWIDGGPNGYETSLTVWREVPATPGMRCGDFGRAFDVDEIVTFDEAENAVGSGDERFVLPATSLTRVADADSFPQLANGANGGWIYLNLDDSRSDDFASQAWVISSMRAEGRYATDVEATALGNGCSAPVPTSAISLTTGAPIAPAENESNRHGVASTDNDDSCDIALLPAATLLLPYFEVDLDAAGATTLLSIVNVSPKDQIARVTLWTDHGYPVLTFNAFLTGYDVQSIDLYDVLARGIIGSEAGTGTRVTDRGAFSERNRGIDSSACRQLPGRLADEHVMRMQRAFTDGALPGEDCEEVGEDHDNAVGYATIDLVTNCSTNDPFAREYWTQDLGYENVLIGDYQQLDSRNDSAQGSPMVHIRAIPEGGPSGDGGGLPRTFYGRYQPAASPTLDARQPLPSTFAARWVVGTWWFEHPLEMTLKIWREGRSGRRCAARDDNVLWFTEIVRFDDAENAFVDDGQCLICPPWGYPRLAATSRIAIDDDPIIPKVTNGAVSGWIYLNLDDDSRTPWIGSNWVVVSIRERGHSAFDFDVGALGNGCSPSAPLSETSHGEAIIGPRPNRNP